MLIFLICLCFGVTCCLDSGQPVVVMVIQAKPSATDIPRLLKTLGRYMPDQVEVLSARRNGKISLLAAEQHQQNVLKLVRKFNIRSQAITVTRVETADIEHGWSVSERKRKRSIEDFQLEAYNTFESIIEYLRMLASSFPHICQTEVIGHTYEDNEVIVVKLHGSDVTKPRAKIFIDGTQHAREWISPAVLVYIINKLVTGYDTRDEWAENMLEKYEFHIIPVANPDGYMFSHNSSANRFWRKNRKGNSYDPSCVGVDLNRNWGFQWSGMGGSSYPCSNVYFGATQFSEAETLAVFEYISRYNGSWHSYFSFHSYGQLILFPWSHSADESPDYGHHLTAGMKMAEGIKQTFNRTDYTVGSVGRLLCSFSQMFSSPPSTANAASGSSESWAYGSGNFPYSYTLELPGLYHFVVPKELIAPTALEIIAGLESYLTYIEEARPALVSGLLETSRRYLESSTTTSRPVNGTTSASPQQTRPQSTSSRQWTSLVSTYNTSTQKSTPSPASTHNASTQKSTPSPVSTHNTSTQKSTPSPVSTHNTSTQKSTPSPVSTHNTSTQKSTPSPVSTHNTSTQKSTPSPVSTHSFSSISTSKSSRNETISHHVTKETYQTESPPPAPKCHGKCRPSSNLQQQLALSFNSASCKHVDFLTYLFCIFLITYNNL